MEKQACISLHTEESKWLFLFNIMEAIEEKGPLEEDYTQDGTVDLQGRPVLRSKTGTWKACSFLVGKLKYFTPLYRHSKTYFIFPSEKKKKKLFYFQTLRVIRFPKFLDCMNPRNQHIGDC